MILLMKDEMGAVEAQMLYVKVSETGVAGSYAGAIRMTTHVCTMKCPKCGNTATKPKPADQFKCENCGWKL